MNSNKSVDLDLYGRGFDGIFGEGSELASKKHALQKLKAMEDFRVHVKPGTHIDYDLYGRGDPRVFATTEETTGQPEPEPESDPALNTDRARSSKFSPRTFLVPVKLLKKKVGAFVRKLSGSSARRSGDESPRSASRSASVQSVTPVTIPEETVSEVDVVSVSDEAPGGISLSPISDVRDAVEEDPVQNEDATRDATLLDDNVVTVVDSADVESMSDTEHAAYEDIVDNVPRRVRSKLPSEEEQPYIEPGIVSKVIAKLNSASSVAFKQAPSFVKNSSLLPLSPTAARAVTEIRSSADSDESGSSRTVSHLLSLTQSSVLSEVKHSSGQSELVDTSSPGRVERLCSLFQEQDSPSLFQYGTSGFYATKSSCSELGKKVELNGDSPQPLIPSPRDVLSSSVHHDQDRTAQKAESSKTGGFDSKRLSSDDVADVTASDATLLADESNAQGESASSSEATAAPLVPGGLSCDSQADLDHTDLDRPESHSGEELEEGANRELFSKANEAASKVQHGENTYLHASGSIEKSGSDVQPVTVEDGTLEESLNKEGSEDSRTSSGEYAEETAKNRDEGNAAVSGSGDSASGAVPLPLGEKKETEITFDGGESEAVAVMSSQGGSAIPAETSSNRIVPMNFVQLLSKMFDDYY